MELNIKMLWMVVIILIAGSGVCISRHTGLTVDSNHENEIFQTEYPTVNAADVKGVDTLVDAENQSDFNLSSTSIDADTVSYSNDEKGQISVEKNNSAVHSIKISETVDIAINWTANNNEVATEINLQLNEVEGETKLQGDMQGIDIAPLTMTLKLDGFSENVMTDFRIPVHLNEKDESRPAATNSAINKNIPVPINETATNPGVKIMDDKNDVLEGAALHQSDILVVDDSKLPHILKETTENTVSSGNEAEITQRSNVSTNISDDTNSVLLASSRFEKENVAEAERMTVGITASGQNLESKSISNEKLEDEQELKFTIESSGDSSFNQKEHEILHTTVIPDTNFKSATIHYQGSDEIIYNEERNEHIQAESIENSNFDQTTATYDTFHIHESLKVVHKKTQLNEDIDMSLLDNKTLQDGEVRSENITLDLIQQNSYDIKSANDTAPLTANVSVLSDTFRSDPKNDASTTKTELDDPSLNELDSVKEPSLQIKTWHDSEISQRKDTEVQDLDDSIEAVNITFENRENVCLEMQTIVGEDSCLNATKSNIEKVTKIEKAVDESSKSDNKSVADQEDIKKEVKLDDNLNGQTLIFDKMNQNSTGEPIDDLPIVKTFNENTGQQEIATETVELTPIESSETKAPETKESINSNISLSDPLDIYKETLLEGIRLSDPEVLMKAEEEAFDAAIIQLIQQGLESYNEQQIVEILPTTNIKEPTTHEVVKKYLEEDNSEETSVDPKFVKVNVSEPNRDLPSETPQNKPSEIRSENNFDNHSVIGKKSDLEVAKSKVENVNTRKSNESSVDKPTSQVIRVNVTNQITKSTFEADVPVGSKSSNTTQPNFSENSLQNSTEELQAKIMPQASEEAGKTILTTSVPDVKQLKSEGLTDADNQKNLSCIFEAKPSKIVSEENTFKLQNISFAVTLNENHAKYISSTPQSSNSSIITRAESLEVTSIADDLLPRESEPVTQSHPEVSRPRDVQPPNDAIEDLIEQVIETLNAPKEVEELLEREIEESFNAAPKRHSEGKEKSEESSEELKNSETFSNTDKNEILILNGIVNSASDVAELQSFSAYAPTDFKEEITSEKFGKKWESNTSYMDSEEVSLETTISKSSQKEATVEQKVVRPEVDSKAYFTLENRNEKQKVENISPELTNSELISEEHIEVTFKTDSSINNSEEIHKQTVSKMKTDEVKLQLTNNPKDFFREQVNNFKSFTQVSESELKKSKSGSTAPEILRGDSDSEKHFSEEITSSLNLNLKYDSDVATFTNKPLVMTESNDESDEEHSNGRLGDIVHQELFVKEHSSGVPNTFNNIPNVALSIPANSVSKRLDNIKATHYDNAPEIISSDALTQHIENTVGKVIQETSSILTVTRSSDIDMAKDQKQSEIISPDLQIRERLHPLSEIGEPLIRTPYHQPVFQGRSMLSEELIVPQSLQVAADFTPTRVEFDSVGLEPQKVSDTDTSKNFEDHPGRSVDDQTGNPEISTNHFMETVVEAAELTTEMNRFIWTFHSSMASNEEISLPSAHTPATTIRSKLVESRSIVSRLEPYEQVAATNLAIIIAVCVTVLFLLMVLLVFGIKMRNQHGTLNIELAEQQINSYVTVPARQDN